MKKAVFGLVNNPQQAQQVVDRLLEEGFDNEFISVLYSDAKGEVKNTSKKGSVVHEKHSKAPEGASVGGLSGGIIGGSLGLLAGIGALAIPGLGPFIAAGPIMAALAGSAVGGSVGLLIGALVGMGLPEYEAKRYEESLKAGGILISIHTDSADDAENAMQILKKAGAHDISTTQEKTRSSR